MHEGNVCEYSKDYIDECDILEFYGKTTWYDRRSPVSILYDDIVHAHYIASNGVAFDISTRQGKLNAVRHELSLTAEESINGIAPH